MTNPTSRQPTDPHAEHDLELVAAYAAGDLDGFGAVQVEGLQATCAACTELVTDLRAIAAATRQLPAPASPSDLDFRLTPTDAARLSRGHLWRRLLRPFGTRGSAARPLSLAFTTLGLAGLLFATLPLLSGFGSGAAAPQAAGSRYSSTANGAVEGSAGREALTPTGSKAAATGFPGAGDLTSGSAAPTPPQFAAASAGPSSLDTLGQVATAVTTGEDGPSPLVALSIAFLAAGVGLIVLRRLATRLR